MEKVVFRAQKL